MADFLHTDARWGEHFVEVSDPHKEGHHVRFYFEPPQDKLIAKLTEMLEIQQKLHETAIDMLKPAIEIAAQKEREVCAKLADCYADGLERNYSASIAEAIRARGQA
jgi:hypothetical protein